MDTHQLQDPSTLEKLSELTRSEEFQERVQRLAENPSFAQVHRVRSVKQSDLFFSYNNDTSRTLVYLSLIAFEYACRLQGNTQKT